MPNLALPMRRACAITRAKAASLSSEYRPRQPWVMRPCRSTWVASTITRAAPECANMPRCIRCQSLAQPSSAEYWHIGETTMRLASSRPATRKGVNKVLGMRIDSTLAGTRHFLALLDGLQIGNDGTDIVGVKLEFRHIRMAGHDALSQRLLQGLNRIALSESAKRRRKFVRAVTAATDRMARCAIVREQLLRRA